MEAGLTRELASRALVERNPEAVRHLVRELTPVVRANVVRVLFRRRGASEGRSMAQDVDDLVQEVFAFLLAGGGKKIRDWDPRSGSASAYFGVISRRHTHNILCSRKQSPWTETPVESEAFDAQGSELESVEKLLHSRDLLRSVERRLHEGLSERDSRLFHLLYVRQEDDTTVQEELGLERDALYQARSRLLKRARALVSDLLEETERRVVPT